MKRTIIALIPEESPIYYLHPATRLVMFVVTGFIPIFIDMPEINFLFIVGLFILFRYARVNLSSLKIYLPMLVTVGCFIFLTYIFFPGRNPDYIPLVKIFGWQTYYQPIRWALVSYVRILALLFASIFYFSTNRERDILASLRSIGLPFAASYLAGLTLRSVGMFLEDYRIIREAERARGLDESSMRFLDKVKLYAMYMIPLFTVALRRADEISNALYAKGYTFSGGTSTGVRRADYILSGYKKRPLDSVLTTVLLIAWVGVMIADIGFGLFNVDHSPLNAYVLKLVQ